MKPYILFALRITQKDNKCFMQPCQMRLSMLCHLGESSSETFVVNSHFNKSNTPLGCKTYFLCMFVHLEPATSVHFPESAKTFFRMRARPDAYKHVQFIQSPCKRFEGLSQGKFIQTDKVVCLEPYFQMMEVNKGIVNSSLSNERTLLLPVASSHGKIKRQTHVQSKSEPKCKCEKSHPKVKSLGLNKH